MVADVAKAGAAIAFLSVIAANFVSHQTEKLDKERLTQVADAASKGRPVDPMVTGSVLKRVGETRLDPCVVPRDCVLADWTDWSICSSDCNGCAPGEIQSAPECPNDNSWRLNLYS